MGTAVQIQNIGESWFSCPLRCDIHAGCQIEGIAKWNSHFKVEWHLFSICFVSFKYLMQKKKYAPVSNHQCGYEWEAQDVFFNLQAKCRLDLVWISIKELCWMADMWTLDLSRWGPFHMQKSPWTQSFLCGKPCSFARRGRIALTFSWQA